MSGSPTLSTSERQTRSNSLSTTFTNTSLSLLQQHTQPSLDELKLSHIINRETCPPIALDDFMAFVTHKEFTSENVLFVLWFRGYRERYENLEQDTRRRVPVPSTKLGDRYRPFEHWDRAMASEERGELRESSKNSQSSKDPRIRAVKTPQQDFKPCRPAEGETSSCDSPTHHHGSPSRFSFRRKVSSNTSPVPILLNTSSHPSVPPTDIEMLPIAEQPFRQEARQAFATFLRKGGSRELGVSDEMREYVKVTLARSTAPECFFPVFEEVYEAVESQTLPHFLQYAKSNINRPKQVFWYIIGVIDLFIGVSIFVVITLLVKQRNYGYRAIRLPSVVFFAFGAMQSYSAWRGFCTQVWGRSNRQIRPWEMDEYEADEEAVAGVTRPGSLDRLQVSRSAGGGQISSSSLKDDEMNLPIGVHPLTDLSGQVKRDSILPWETPEVENDMTEIALRQLAIRRATIKAPDPSLAFPLPLPHDATAPQSAESISENTFPFLVTPPTPLMPSERIGPNERHEISPFKIPDFNPAYEGSGPGPDPEIELAIAPTSEASAAPQPDLSSLLSKYRPSPREPPDKPPGKMPENPPPDQKVKSFGPELLVEDPRVKKLYNGVIRDILIVGVSSGLLMTALCFGVPMAGLV